MQNSSVEIINSTVAFIYWFFDAHLKATNVDMASFVFYGENDTQAEEIYFKGLNIVSETDLTLDSTLDGGSLFLENCTVYWMWSFNFNWDFRKKITIEDSVVGPLWIKFPPTDEWIAINELPHGYIKEYDLNESVYGISLPYGIKLINTYLSDFKPEMLNTKAVISNSYAMVHPYDKTELLINDTILVGMNNYGCEYIEFNNVSFIDILQFLSKPDFVDGYRIGDKVVGPGGTFYWKLHNSRINVNEIVVAVEEGTLEGEYEIIKPKSFDNVKWVKGEITRIYPVKANAKESVFLRDDDDNILWSGLTDQFGNATFSIVFSSENYDQTYSLEGENFEQEISFLSNTPVDLLNGN